MPFGSADISVRINMREVKFCSKDIVELWIFDHPVIDGKINAEFSVYRISDDSKIRRNIIAFKNEGTKSITYNVEDDLPEYRYCTSEQMLDNMKEAVYAGFSVELKFSNDYVKYVIFESDDSIFIVDSNKRNTKKASAAPFDMDEFCDGCTVVDFMDL